MEWIIKLIGVAIIIIFGILVGRKSVERLKNRVEILSEIISVLSSVKNSFLFRHSDLLTAFNEAEMIRRRYFDVTLSKLEGTRFKEQLTARLNNATFINILLSKVQKDKLYDSLLEIGIGSLEEECGRLDYYINFFRSEMENANVFYKENQRLYYAISLYASIVLSVILI